MSDVVILDEEAKTHGGTQIIPAVTEQGGHQEKAYHVSVAQKNQYYIKFKSSCASNLWWTYGDVLRGLEGKHTDQCSQGIALRQAVRCPEWGK